MPTSTDQPPDRLLTADEVAETLRVAPRTVLRWAALGQLPAIRTPGGRLKRFRESDVRAVLDAANGEPLTSVSILTSERTTP
jgi:excisionase family DNA binding protein